MIDQSLAGITTRTQRGVELWLTRRAEIVRVVAHTYRVPSCSGGGPYTVNTDLRACDCPDHPAAKEQGERCKHFHAALLTMQHRRELRRLAEREMDKR